MEQSRREGAHGLFYMTVVIGLQLLDYKTTRVGLAHGAPEANILVAAIIENWGWTALLIFKIAIGVVCGAIAWSRPLFGWLFAVVYLWVCYANVETLARMLNLAAA